MLQNDREAVKWYLRAAEQGYPDAQFNLGMSYEFGEGVDQDVGAAIRWYRKAAEQENERAIARLKALEL